MFTKPTTSTVPTVEDIVRQLQEIHEEVKTMIKIVGDQAKLHYDQHVQHQPNFKVGEKVLLRHKHIATTAPSKKLSPKFLGPFIIIAKISDLVYQLKLPPTLRIHNVFHVCVLERYHEDTIPGRKQISPPPIIIPEGDT